MSSIKFKKRKKKEKKKANAFFREESASETILDLDFSPNMAFRPKNARGCIFGP
jgi:hypothetical protein